MPETVALEFEPDYHQSQDAQRPITEHRWGLSLRMNVCCGCWGRNPDKLEGRDHVRASTHRCILTPPEWLHAAHGISPNFNMCLRRF